MNERRVIVVACRQIPRPMREIDRLLPEALLKLGFTVTSHTCDATHLGSLDIDSSDVIVLVGQVDDCRDKVLACVMRCEGLGVPLVAAIDADQSTRDVMTVAGVMLVPPDTESTALAAMLAGVLHRQGYVTQLLREVDVTRRVRGGLTGEIDKMHEEMQLAAVVQRELLPSDLPCLLGVEVDALWRPAHYVSGDIFDVQQLDEDHLGVFVADAVGHGVPAALMTMVISRSLITREVTSKKTSILPPSEVLRRLNERLIQRQGTNTRFATGAYAVINCRERTAEIAGAGHPAVLQMKSSGDTIEIESQGGLLGVFEDESYESAQVELDVDDRLLIYSDGFEQAFPEEESSTAHDLKRPTHRYRHEFESLRSASNSSEMIEMIAQRLDEQAGSLHQADDLTIVCVRSMSLGQTFSLTEDHRQADQLVDSLS